MTMTENTSDSLYCCNYIIYIYGTPYNRLPRLQQTSCPLWNSCGKATTIIHETMCDLKLYAIAAVAAVRPLASLALTCRTPLAGNSNLSRLSPWRHFPQRASAPCVKDEWGRGSVRRRAACQNGGDHSSKRCPKRGGGNNPKSARNTEKV